MTVHIKYEIIRNWLGQSEHGNINVDFEFKVKDYISSFSGINATQLLTEGNTDKEANMDFSFFVIKKNTVIFSIVSFVYPNQ